MRFWSTGLMGCHRCDGKGTLLGGSRWQKIGHPAAVLEVAVLVRGRIGWQKLGHPAAVLEVTVCVWSLCGSTCFTWSLCLLLLATSMRMRLGFEMFSSGNANAPVPAV
jgi:hypothetical protein